MKIKANIVLFCSLIFQSMIGLSQHLPIYGQYMLNPIFINPAFTGHHKALSTTFHIRNQWLSFDPDKDITPNTYTLVLDSPLKNKSTNIGMAIVHDRFGITSQLDHLGFFAHRIQLKSNIKITFGLQLGYSYLRQNFSKIDETNDPIALNNAIFSRFAPKIGFGLLAQWKNLSLSSSMPQFYFSSLDRSIETYNTAYITQVYTFLSYHLNLNRDFVLKPSLLNRFNNYQGINNFDLNSVLEWQKMYSMGVSYRVNNSVMALFHFQKEQMNIAFAYEYPINELSNFTNGSYEVMFRYTFSYGINAVNTKTFK